MFDICSCLAYAVAETEEKKQPIFYIQSGAILISCSCYIAAFITIGNHPSRNDQIAKLALWFFPVVLEVIAHFVVQSLLEHKRYALAIKYDEKTFHARSATVFIIVLGGGLDNITKGFHYMVGNLSFGAHRIGVIFCCSLIFILLFTLHFTTIPDLSEPKKDERRKRDLAIFFSGFFYLAAVVITLQGVSAMMQVGVSVIVFTSATN